MLILAENEKTNLSQVATSHLIRLIIIITIIPFIVVNNPDSEILIKNEFNYMTQNHFNLILLNNDNEVIKILSLNGSGKINPKEERTYRSIKIDNINSYKYYQYKIEFVSGQKVK